LEQYKKKFIDFLVGAQVLTFGDFVTKSGRKTPYFVNTGRYRMGSQLGQLGKYYAHALTEKLGTGFDNLYGPAYKGISLAVTTGIALIAGHGHDVSISYNRKEAKDHGEKGVLIGHQYEGSEKVVIIEDVITAGTSIRESMSILKQNCNPHITSVIVSVDRMERGQSDLGATQEVAREFGLDVFSIVTVKEIISYLHNHPVQGQIYIDDDTRQRMELYLKEYGV
jgi:orotate phosphoribosyltransferase